MKYCEGNIGRIFILRLEHGDRIPYVLEEFAISKKIEAATVLFLGGADQDSSVVTGPEDASAKVPVSILEKLTGVSEGVGVGTIFVNEQKLPKLHLHSAFGRKSHTIAGCAKKGGITIWHIGEVVIFELINTSAVRKIDSETGYELLEV